MLNLRKWQQMLLLFLAALLVVGIILPARAGNLDDYFDDLEDIEQQLEDMKDNRDKTERELKLLRARLESLNRSVALAEIELADLASKIGDMESRIVVQEQLVAAIQSSIDETEEYLATQIEYLEHRLCAMYKNGSVSYLEVLFSASSFSDFLTRFGFIRRLVEGDTELVAEIEETKDELEASRNLLAAELASLEDNLAELEEARLDAEAVHAKLVAETKESVALKKKVEAKLAEQKKGIASLEADQKAVEAMIRKLQEEERIRAGNPPSSYLWPVPGFDRSPYNITCPYGWRIHPITGKPNFHTGIDIARLNRQGESIGGKPIVAAASGTVEFVRSYDGGGYGIYAIISHGGGYQTLYAHMRKVLVKEGDVVHMGDQIGIVGTTGSSTGNHLHFETWVMTERKDPLDFLPLTLNTGNSLCQFEYTLDDA